MNIMEDYYKFRKWKEMFLFNDAHKTFWLWLYGGIEHMVKDHSDSR